LTHVKDLKYSSGLILFCTKTVPRVCCFVPKRRLCWLFGFLALHL